MRNIGLLIVALVVLSSACIDAPEPGDGISVATTTSSVLSVVPIPASAFTVVQSWQQPPVLLDRWYFGGPGDTSVRAPITGVPIGCDVVSVTVVIDNQTEGLMHVEVIDHGAGAFSLGSAHLVNIGGEYDFQLNVDRVRLDFSSMWIYVTGEGLGHRFAGASVSYNCARTMVAKDIAPASLLPGRPEPDLPSPVLLTVDGVQQWYYLAAGTNVGMLIHNEIPVGCRMEAMRMTYRRALGSYGVFTGEIWDQYPGLDLLGRHDSGWAPWDPSLRIEPFYARRTLEQVDYIALYAKSGEAGDRLYGVRLYYSCPS